MLYVCVLLGLNPVFYNIKKSVVLLTMFSSVFGSLQMYCIVLFCLFILYYYFMFDN